MPNAATGTSVPPSISVIITAFTFDRLPSIEETIESLRNQSIAPAEVILVVDHAPELLEECKRLWPDVRVIANRQEPGSCGGRNTGVAESNGAVVAFLDDDAVPGRDWIERLGTAYADPRVLSVGGGVRPRWLTKRPSWFPPEFDWIIGCAHSGMPREREPVRNVIIANMSIRRDAMLEVGGLRQEFSRIQKNAAGAEETDLCIRLTARWPESMILFDPEAAVEHFVPEERTKLKYFIGRCFAEGRSKAALAQMVGTDSGLAAERSYVRRTLPLGVLRDLGGVFKGDVAGAARAGAIVAGLAITVAGYLTAPRLKAKDAELVDGDGAARPRRPQPPSPDFAPARMDEVEIGAALPALPAGSSRSGAPFAASLCLVRLHGAPLGLIELDLPDDGLSSADLAARISAELGEQAASHLSADGLPAAEISPGGLDGSDVPACLAERDELLADPPSLSVVICTRNRPDSVRITLRSILACRYPTDRWEVIVVDNASEPDPSIEKAAAAAASGEVAVKVVHEPVPGLSNARNCGVRSAGGEIVVFADDDVEVDRNWLRVLAAPFRSDERVGATSGLTLPGALETPVQRWTEGFGGRVRPLAVRRFDLSDPPPDRPLFPFTVGELGAGRNMAFRRDLLERLGGFDPALGPGSIAHDGDDIEALLRVILSGNVVVNDPAAIVWHAHPDDYGELEDRVWGYGIGLTACLTKAIIDHPSLLLGLLRKLPRGLAFAILPRSEKNRGRQRDFPRSLARRELLGMAYGPIAYSRSRLRVGRRRPVANPPRSRSEASHLRVLLVTDEYRPVIGGAARNIGLLAQQVARRGHTVAVATSWQPETPAQEDEGKVRIHRIRDLTSRMRWISDDPHRHHAPPFPDPEATFRLRRLIAEFEPDLVHAYGWLTASTAAALAGSKTPLLVSTHDYGNVCAQFTLVREGKPCSGPAPTKCLACAQSTYGIAKGSVAVGSLLGVRPLLRRKVDAIHSVSRFTGEMTGRNLAIPGVEPVVIPNFLEPNDDEPLDDALLAELPEEPFIFFVGHLRPYKGIEVLLRAYERLEDPPPLVLVGTLSADTPDSFPAGVKVFTYVPHGTVMAMWERALFGVSPSIAAEALPSVVLEAMSKGKAMIGSRIGGYLDLIDEGKTGLLSEPGDDEELAMSMARLIGDEELREALGGEAAVRARLFSPEKIVPRIERLYRQTVAAAEVE
jgi:glycosyltransferase involved in cell wall biosynthesis/GT2 family glycosyltransferase